MWDQLKRYNWIWNKPIIVTFDQRLTLWLNAPLTKKKTQNKNQNQTINQHPPPKKKPPNQPTKRTLLLSLACIRVQILGNYVLCMNVSFINLSLHGWISIDIHGPLFYSLIWLKFKLFWGLSSYLIARTHLVHFWPKLEVEGVDLIHRDVKLPLFVLWSGGIQLWLYLIGFEGHFNSLKAQDKCMH